MAAALRAAEMGADVVLVDDGPELGGTLLAGEGAADAREAAERVRAAGVEVLAPAAALGFFDGIVPVWQGSTLHQVRADHHVAATGSIEQPLLFEGNDLPGVMLCSGAERLAHLYGVAPAIPLWSPPQPTADSPRRWRFKTRGSRSPRSRTRVPRAAPTLSSGPGSTPQESGCSRAPRSSRRSGGSA